jgi:REP element-mobilizing transposase RayT
MPRKLRLEYEGAIYHVMNRGDRREDIFLDDRDREGFLKALGETCRKADWQVHAYCLMGNHFHLVVETPRANLSAGMQWFLGTYGFMDAAFKWLVCFVAIQIGLILLGILPLTLRRR